MTDISRRTRRLRLNSTRKARRSILLAGSGSSLLQPTRFRSLACEELEPRRLLAVGITKNDSELMQWHGNAVAVERGEWIVQFDGPRNNPNGLKLGPLMRSARAAYPAI